MGSPVKFNVRTGGAIPIRPKRVLKYASPLDKAKGYEVAWQQVAPLFEAARGIEDVSFVYFIGEDGDDGPIKIGVAKDPGTEPLSTRRGPDRALRSPWIAGLHPAQATDDARAQLLPIIATAAAEQVRYLLQAEGEVGAETERIVRDAHVAHGFVAQGRDLSYTLARGAGYVVSGRPSRL